jgi:hypothetical protein
MPTMTTAVTTCDDLVRSACAKPASAAKNE